MTYIGHARLECDGLEPFDLTIEEGFAVDSLDIGYPAVRAVTNLKPDTDGETDQTAFFGARAVVLGGVIVPRPGIPALTRQAVLDRLGAFLVPSRRPWLIFELEPGSGERRIRLRPDQHSRPIVRPGYAIVTVGWRAPDGTQESNVLEELTLNGWPVDELGRVYDLDFDRAYPQSDPIGVSDIDLDGNLPVASEIVVTGPCTSPRILNLTTGERISFPALVLDTGETLTIDMVARTAFDSINIERRPDFTVSTWWMLYPGINRIRYAASVVDVGTNAVIRYRSAWI